MRSLEHLADGVSLVTYRFPEIRLHSRSILARMESAVACHMNGLLFLL